MHQPEDHDTQYNLGSDGEEPYLLPEDAYHHLPPPLSKTVNSFGQPHARAVFLASSLPVLAGCMPNVEGMYKQGHLSTISYVWWPPRQAARAQSVGRVAWARPFTEMKQRAQCRSALPWRTRYWTLAVYSYPLIRALLHLNMRWPTATVRG